MLRIVRLDRFVWGGGEWRDWESLWQQQSAFEFSREEQASSVIWDQPLSVCLTWELCTRCERVRLDWQWKGKMKRTEGCKGAEKVAGRLPSGTRGKWRTGAAIFICWPESLSWMVWVQKRRRERRGEGDNSWSLALGGRIQLVQERKPAELVLLCPLLRVLRIDKRLLPELEQEEGSKGQGETVAIWQSYRETLWSRRLFLHLQRYISSFYTAIILMHASLYLGKDSEQHRPLQAIQIFSWGTWYGADSSLDGGHLVLDNGRHRCIDRNTQIIRAMRIHTGHLE